MTLTFAHTSLFSTTSSLHSFSTFHSTQSSHFSIFSSSVPLFISQTRSYLLPDFSFIVLPSIPSHRLTIHHGILQSRCFDRPGGRIGRNNMPTTDRKIHQCLRGFNRRWHPGHRRTDRSSPRYGQAVNLRSIEAGFGGNGIVEHLSHSCDGRMP